MSKLFEYSKIAVGKHFVGREEEVKRLSSDFIFLTNTAVLAPQGWGKSSLVQRAAKDACHKEKTLRFCRIDLSNVRNEERFYELFVQEVLRSVSGNRTEVVENVEKYFPHTSPRVTFGSSGAFSVDLDWEEIRRNQDELLDLPYLVAKDKGIKMVVCVDEFHAISRFSDPEALLDRFKDRWKRHTGVAYCISGCRVSLVEGFLKASSVFYRYGDVIDLGPIGRREMVKFLRDTFADSAKYLDADIAELIIDKAEGNAFYTKQLAHISWLGTSVVCSREVVLQSFETIVDQMDMVFRNITESLTGQQLCYIHAVMAGETVISTSEVLHRHHITSATSASRSKTALLERGIVSSVNGRICMTDPIYSYWLTNRYFNDQMI